MPRRPTKPKWDFVTTFPVPPTPRNAAEWDGLARQGLFYDAKAATFYSDDDEPYDFRYMHEEMWRMLLGCLWCAADHDRKADLGVHGPEAKRRKQGTPLTDDEVRQLRSVAAAAREEFEDIVAWYEGVFGDAAGRAARAYAEAAFAAEAAQDGAPDDHVQLGLFACPAPTSTLHGGSPR